MQELENWSKKNRLKAEIPFTQDTNHVTGRGLYSTKSYRRGDPLLQVPSGFILDLHFILDKYCSTFEFFDTFAVSCYPKKVAIPAEDVFIHFLCTEEKEKKASRVAGWISSFPRESYNLPFNWPADLQKCVCDDSLQLAIKEQVADFNALCARFEHYCTVIDDVKFSRDTLAWAYSVWSARLFELPQFPESSTNSVNLPKWLDNDPSAMTSFGFLPIFDLLNHSSTPNVFLQIRKKHVWDKTKKIHPEEKFILSLEAKTKIAKGEELRLSYGDFSDRELFLKYGFVLKKGENKAARLLVSSKMVHDTGINASGAYCSYDALNVTIKERKEVVRELCSDEFYLDKASNDKNTSLHKAALAFVLTGTTKESIILHIKERLDVNQKAKIALKHFYVFLAESVKSKTKEDLAELEFRMCRERNPVKYHLLKSLKENEIALANELFEIHNNQLQILKNNVKGGKLQKTPHSSDANIREAASSGNQNILSRIREKLARKSRTTDDTKVVSVAERAAGFAKIMEEKEKIQEPVTRNIQIRRSLTRSEMKGRRESDSDMSIDSGYSYKTDASKNSFLSASSIYSSDRPRSGRTYERPQFSPKPSLTRSNISTDRASFSRTYERGSYFNRSDSVERRSRVNAAINTYSSSPTASSFSSSGRYDRSYRIPSLSSSSYSSSSSSSALMTTGRYSSRLGAVSASLNAIIATQTRCSSSSRFQNTTSASINRIRT